VDDIVVIAKGQLRASGPIDQVIHGDGGGVVRVRARDLKGLAGALDAAGLSHGEGPSGSLLVSGSSGEAVGDAANSKSVALSELTEVARSLEDVFMDLTGDDPAAEDRS
jgi:hypothetical protein